MRVLLHVVKSATSTPAGRLADRIGSARLVPVGWLLFSVSYVALALAASWPWTLAAMLLFGFHRALAEGAEKALVADLAPVHLRGSAFGLYHLVVGIGALPASLLFGLIWQKAAPVAAFGMGAVLALLAGLLLSQLTIRTPLSDR